MNAVLHLSLTSDRKGNGKESENGKVNIYGSCSDDGGET